MKEKESDRKKQIYSVGIYARLSVDHRIKRESIASQIASAKAYLTQQEGMKLYNCYIDLGESGTHFKRNGFLKLMEDIREKRVNCIIVKDFSRFGRNYIEVENYIDKIFPFLGVRFISITDEFDSLHQEKNRLDRNIKNLINEIYVNDTAQKVKEVKQFCREQGNYLGSKAPYGYKIESREGKRVLIQDDAFPVAEKMLQMFLEGKNQREIAVWLYQNQVHRPSDYRRTGHIYCTGEEPLFEWQRGSIWQVLNRLLLMHQKEGILKQKDAVKDLKNRKTEQSYWKTKPLSLDCYCGDCGKKLAFRKDLKQGIFYCAQAGRIDRFQCKKKQITEQNLSLYIKILFEHLLQEKALLAFGSTEKRELEKYIENYIIKQRKKQKAERKRIKQQIMAAEQIINKRYMDYQLQRISKEEFFIKKQIQKEKIKRLERKKQKILQRQQKMEEQQIELIKWMEKIAEGQMEQIQDPFFFLLIIKRVELFSEKRILIRLNIRRC